MEYTAYTPILTGLYFRDLVWKGERTVVWLCGSAEVILNRNGFVQTKQFEIDRQIYGPIRTCTSLRMWWKYKLFLGEKNKNIKPLISAGYFYFIYRLEIQMHVYIDTIQYETTLCPVHALNAYRESGGVAPLILKKGTRWGESLNSCSVVSC